MQLSQKKMHLLSLKAQIACEILTVKRTMQVFVAGSSVFPTFQTYFDNSKLRTLCLCELYAFS